MPRTASLHGRKLPRQFPEGARELRELIDQGAVTVVFQLIFRIPDGAIGAYEVLGRGRHPRLPEGPGELFRIAESLGAEGELSRLFRRKTVELVRHRTNLPTLFLNMHPVELSRPGFWTPSRSCDSWPPTRIWPWRYTRTASPAPRPSPSWGGCCRRETSASPTTISAPARRAFSSWLKLRHY